MGLAQRAHVINESRDRSMLAANAEHDAESLDTTPALLPDTVDVGHLTSPPTPLPPLTESTLASLATIGYQNDVQSSGQIMPTANYVLLIPQRSMPPTRYA